MAVVLSLEMRRRKDNKKKYMAAWAVKNRKKAYEAARRSIDKLRQDTFDAYGGRCKDCGETDLIVLVLDHIKDDAAIDRAVTGKRGGFHLYRRLRLAGFPQGRYQVLCHNCNFRKEFKRRRRNYAVEEQKTA